MSVPVYTHQEVAAILDKIWQDVVSYPFPQVCKHLVASNILSKMEVLGMGVPEHIADAVVTGEDDRALAWKRVNDQADNASGA